MEAEIYFSIIFKKVINLAGKLKDSTIKNFGRVAGYSVYQFSKIAAEIMNKSKNKIGVTSATKMRFEPFFNDLNWDKILIVEKANLPANLINKNIAGMTFGHIIYTKYENIQTDYIGLFNLLHELVHVKQIEMIGEIEFAKRYGQQFITYGGYSQKMPFEGEAYGLVANIPFNPFYYTRVNKIEISQKTKTEAFIHWLDFGIEKGLRACEFFNPSDYLEKVISNKTYEGKLDYKTTLYHWLWHENRKQ